MSWPLIEWPLASADGLPLSESDCLLLLDADIDNDGDLLRSFPCAAAKLGLEPGAEAAEYCGEEGAALLYPPSPQDTKPSRAQLASDLLQQLDTQCKTESFPSWLEEKVDLPIFESIPAAPERSDVAQLAFHAAAAPLPPAALLPPPPPPPQLGIKCDTAELLREFETVYGAVELTHLTPPQSPPGPATQLLLTYAHHAQAPAAAPAPWPLLPPQQPHELEREMAVVEELMRHSAAHLVAPHHAASASASPSCSPPSSPRSPGSPHSPHSPHSPASSHSSSASCSADEEWERERPHRAKPYSRSSDDRRSRKKEQNKNAATRYRQKKKAEIEVLLGEESALRQRQGDLDTKCADLQREIRYLKGLMRDLFKAKGLIK